MGDLLLRAIQQGNTKLFRNCMLHLQFDYKDYSNSLGQTPLTIAALHSRTSFIRALIVAQADVNKPDGLGRTPAEICAERGDLKSLELLVRAGANIIEVAATSPKAAYSCMLLVQALNSL